MPGVRSIAVVGMAFVAGCAGGSDEKVVARAGEIVVSLADFHAAYNAITPNFRPDISTLEARRSFAQDILNKEILVTEGRRLGIHEDPQVMRVAEQERAKLLRAALHRDQVESKVEVLGKHVETVYEKRTRAVQASAILLEDLDEGRALRARIVAGELTFEEAARRYSKDRSSREQGGSLGEIEFSLSQPDFCDRLFEMNEQELSEPFDGRLGVHILRVDANLPKQLPPLDEMRVNLRGEVRRQLEAVRARAFADSLEQAAGLEWNEEGLGLLLDLMERLDDPGQDTRPAPEQRIPEATAEQSAMPLATFAGKTWTVADHIEALRRAPPNARPSGRIPRRGLKQILRVSQIHDQLLQQAALDLGLDQDREVVDGVQRALEQRIVEGVHARFLQAADVPESDVRALYDSTLAVNPEALTYPARVDLLIIMNPDSAEVAEGLARLRRGEDEAAVVSSVSREIRTLVNGGRTGMIARGNYAPQVEDAAFAADPKDGWLGPIMTESAVAAFRVVEKDAPRVATYEEVKQDTTTELVRARGEAAFEEWLRSERERLGVEIHDEVLELIGQPVS